MPLVWPHVPDARVMLIGSEAPPEIYALAGERVEVVGFAPHLAPYYARARMSVNPLRYGSGVKGKIIASMAAGVPVVTTTIGNEGIGLAHGEEVLVGDTATEIAAHIVALFDDVELLGAPGNRWPTRHRRALLSGAGRPGPVRRAWPRALAHGYRDLVNDKAAAEDDLLVQHPETRGEIASPRDAVRAGSV